MIGFLLSSRTYGRMVSHFFGTRTCFWLVFRPPLLSTRSFSLSLLRCPALGAQAAAACFQVPISISGGTMRSISIKVAFLLCLLTLAGLMLHPGI